MKKAVILYAGLLICNSVLPMFNADKTTRERRLDGYRACWKQRRCFGTVRLEWGSDCFSLDVHDITDVTERERACRFLQAMAYVWKVSDGKIVCGLNKK